MIKFATHLNFDGQCEAAFRFYEKCFGGKIKTLMRWEESPMADRVPREFGKKIIHVNFSLQDQELIGSDSPPGRFEKPQGFCVVLNVNDTKEADRLFTALKEDGKVQMPLDETFWAKRFGMVTDRFGIPWMINCGKS